MKKVMKIALGVLFVVVLLGTFVFLWQKTRPKKEIFNLVEVAASDTLEKRAIATGKVEPRDEVLIKPQISGIISDVYREAGEMIRAGEVIAKVKVIPEMGALNSAQSRVTVAKINLDLVQSEHDRVQQLFSTGVVSREEYDKSSTELARSKEEVQNAQDNLEIVQDGISKRTAELSNTQIRATITGMILDVPVKVGNSVILSNTFNDGTTIAAVADLSDMIFRGKVDETEVGRLREGMPVTVTVGALQAVILPATLEYISPKGTEENGIVLFEIKAALTIPKEVFVRAGYSANADIVIDYKEGVMTIPENTVEFEEEKAYVYVLTSDPALENEQVFDRRPIKIGLSDGINVEVTEGLQGGEKLRGIKK